ncbi:MAG: hypothetical protein IPI24_00070 [Ignavibacteria bacterium]|nr:hypothetical protein [Ignavibacteria bacterium]
MTSDRGADTTHSVRADTGDSSVFITPYHTTRFKHLSVLPVEICVDIKPWAANEPVLFISLSAAL